MGEDPGFIRDLDEHEELVGVLEDMSYREIHVLTILETFERQATGVAKGSDMPAVDRRITMGHWPDFIAEIEDRAGVLHNERTAVITRLNRTGLYESHRDLTDGDGSGIGRLTPRYYRLRDLVANRDGKVI